MVPVLKITWIWVWLLLISAKAYPFFRIRVGHGFLNDHKITRIIGVWEKVQHLSIGQGEVTSNTLVDFLKFEIESKLVQIETEMESKIKSVEVFSWA